ncbi:MAG: hypothetical protein RLN76_11325 [Phycisphaeraceae bacterium]
MIDRNPHPSTLLSCCLSTTLAIGLVSAGTASANLIAGDSFLTGNPADAASGEYITTQFRRGQVNGAGQDPTIPGFTGAWTGNVTSGSLAVAQWTAQSAPTGTTAPYQAGGRARFGGSSAVNGLQRRVQRELSPYTPASTYYMSVITQIATGDLAGAPGFVGVGFTNADASVTQQDANMAGGSALRGLLIGAASSDGATTDFVIRHVGAAGLVDEVVDAGIPNVEPTLTVVRLDFNDDPANPAGNSRISVWHNPDFTAALTEADATADSAPLTFRTFALDTIGDLTHLTMTGINYSKAASFDEVRLATTWEAAVPVPEPATGVLALTALLAVNRRSR